MIKELILFLLPLIIALLVLPLFVRWYLTIIASIADIDSKDIDKLIEKYSLKRKK